ncbi:MAG: helix-turn-helix domain-containing protein [Candidatus Merdivicinus sp.]|jgi:transcriptional regulator with XRE-family HTH domain
MMRTIAENIREARTSRGWSKQQLSQMSGLNKSLIDNYEAGRTYPNLISFIALADAFDMSMDELAGRKRRGKED